MTVSGHSLKSRRLQAPRENRTALVEPPFSAVPDLVQANERLRESYDYDLQGRSLRALVADARRALVNEAGRYTREYRDVDFDASVQRIFLAGHQPQIFHPGVWSKNFALSALARQHGAAAVNLIIDSDTIKDATLRVPGRSVERPHVTLVAMDRPSADIPYEDRRILDSHLFDSFATRVCEALCPLVCDPLVQSFWPLVQARAKQDNHLGLALAQGRHQLEGRWGATTLEIPQSRVCQLEAFHWFTAHLLAQLPRFWECYNQVLTQYRRANRIRSRSHPVPELATEDGYLEAPFWVWHEDDPRRRRLFVRQQGDLLIATDRADIRIELPLTPEGDAHRAVAVLAELPGRGIKLRSRALTTTLLARLILGDLFLHGIGGAKYDELTDQLFQRFFGLEPPGFLIVSATLQLPIDRRRVSDDDARRVDHFLRELTYHPERFVEESSSVAASEQQLDELIRSKQAWIAAQPTPENARQRCRAIRAANEAMQPWVAQKRRATLESHEHIVQALGAEAILSWREYGFCLYPEQNLRDFLLEFLPTSA